jgi:hypothetical protein
MTIIQRAMLLATLAIAALPGALQAQSATSTRSAEGSAVIEAVDQRERSVILRGEDGALTTLFLGDEVRNLPQVKAGDHVVARYTQAVAARMAKAGGGDPGVSGGTAASRVRPGGLPGATFVRGVQLQVTIDAVDRRQNTVTFTGPQGVVRTVAVRDAKMQAFARRLRPGDKVDLTITEGVTVDVVRS